MLNTATLNTKSPISKIVNRNNHTYFNKFHNSVPIFKETRAPQGDANTHLFKTLKFLQADNDDTDDTDAEAITIPRLCFFEKLKIRENMKM